MSFDAYWYVVAESRELGKDDVLARTVLGESLAVFRGDDGRAVALRDRCMHRNAPLSKGTVKSGCLACPYHGWTYDKDGKVVAVPAEGDAFQPRASRAARRFEVREQDDFVYVRLAAKGQADIEPFAMPRYGQPGWSTVRLVNTFANNVTNCAENFIDVPHTAFVHRGTFRTTRKQRIDVSVRRAGGSVMIEYRNETSNLGIFSRFLNPTGRPIQHTDSFHAPNITSVKYVFNPRMTLYITSQSVPEADDRTRVYTDVTYNYGALNRIAKPVIRWHSQQIIDQDLVALADQMAVIRKYGEEFNNTAADAIHVLVESIRNEIAKGGDPRALPEKNAELTFWL